MNSHAERESLEEKCQQILKAQRAETLKEVGAWLKKWGDGYYGRFIYREDIEALLRGELEEK